MRQNYGKIALSREIRSHWVYDDPKILKVWISIILMANFKDGTLILGKKKYTIKRGQTSLSMRSWANELNLGVKSIDTIFKHFEDDNMIKRQIIGVGKQSTTLITVVNYEPFQILGETQAKRNGIATEAEAKQKRSTKASQRADNRIKEIKDNKEVIKRIGEDKFLILTAWVEYRNAIGKPIPSEQSFETLVERFEKESINKCNFVIDASIESGWQGLFWDKYIESTKKVEAGKPNFQSPVL